MAGAVKRRGAGKRDRGAILAIDQGTTGTKAVLVGEDLQVIGEASRELPQHFPRPGWVEHDLEEIHATVRGAVRDVLARTGVKPSRIAAVGITNQRETTALWDRRSGKPVHRAIVWQDRRTAPECEALKRRGLEPLFRRRTGLVLDPYFSGTKLAWLLEHVAGARRAAEAGKLLFGTIDTYLAWRLTRGAAHVTDISNASRTLLMDLAEGAWSDDLLEALDVPRRVLPEIRANDEILGRTRGAGFLPDGIPIASAIGDQQSALFGQACFEEGEAKCTYGTGAFLVLNTGPRILRSRSGLLSTALWRLRGRSWYGLEGSSFIAGAVVQWLRDGLGLIRASGDVEALARRVEDSGGVVLVPALAGLGAPHWDPSARGLIAGITRGTSAAHVARAALEGIAFQIHDLVRAMERDLGRKARGLKVDGGAAGNDLLMQVQADLLGLRISRPQVTSTTA
ncbi:MAG: glycerol kinase GlpK, partial [Planctomycetes bacterium]|nr:glycerol kinase GlpK [Planctomycetota bacterium]